jgi:AAA family ATP:ADP antiporter
MKDAINRTFNLRPRETAIVLVLGLILLCNSVAVQISGIISVSNFLSTGGVNYFPIVWLVDYLLILLIAALQSLIVDRFNRLSLMRGMIFGFALVFTFLRVLFIFRVPGWLNYSLLYLLAEQQDLFVPLVFWILANDIFDMAQTKRLFPLIASWGFAGKLLGIGITAASSGLLTQLDIKPEEMLTLNILIYMLVFLLIMGGLSNVKLRQTRQKSETVRETLSEGWNFVRDVPSFRYLMLAILALSLCDVIIGFHFYVVSDSVFSDPASYQRFFSFYRLAVTLAGFLMQSFLSSRIINRINLKNTFLILPFTTLASAASMIAMPGIVSGVGGMSVLSLTRDTITESARKAFQALVPEERRGRVSMFMDSYLPAGGIIVGSLATGLIVFTGLLFDIPNTFYVYLAGAVLAALFSIWAIFRMRAVYDSSLLNWRLKRRQRGRSVLDSGIMRSLADLADEER